MLNPRLSGNYGAGLERGSNYFKVAMRSILLACAILITASHLVGQLEDFSHINFSKSDSLARLYPRHSLTNLKTLADKLTHSLSTDVEKFNAIYRWTCENIEYDYVLFVKNQRQRAKIKNPELLMLKDRKMNVIMFETLLKKQKTICTGYAYLIRELARHAGLSCIIIDGYGRTSIANVGGTGIANHQWNAVQLNHKWYLCDATWSSGSVVPQVGQYIKEYNGAYFLPDPELFILNHYPLDTTWTLLSHHPSLHEFLNGPLVYSRLFALKATQLRPTTFEVPARKKELVTFQFKAKENQALENISVTIAGQQDFSLPTLKPDSTGLFCINHNFSSRGIYWVHVSQSKYPLFTYKVKVR